MCWQLDVHSPRSATSVRITSSFIVWCRHVSVYRGLHNFYFSRAPPVPYVKRNGLGSVSMTVSTVVSTVRHKDSVSLSSIPSIATTSTLNPNSVTENASDTVSFYHSAKSSDELEMQDQSSPPAVILPISPPASVPPNFSGACQSAMPVHASPSIETV